MCDFASKRYVLTSVHENYKDAHTALRSRNATALFTVQERRVALLHSLKYARGFLALNGRNPRASYEFSQRARAPSRSFQARPLPSKALSADDKARIFRNVVLVLGVGPLLIWRDVHGLYDLRPANRV